MIPNREYDIGRHDAEIKALQDDFKDLRKEVKQEFSVFREDLNEIMEYIREKRAEERTRKKMLALVATAGGVVGGIASVLIKAAVFLAR